jgi:hypothetical protein
MSCDGSPLDVCGDGNRINVYLNAAFSSATSSTSSVGVSTATSEAPISTIPPSPTVVPSVGSFHSSGCFFDTTAARVLIADSQTAQGADGMTVEKCIAFAQDGGWKYAGVEFGM